MTMTRDKIREVFMQHGFTIKEGQTDLKPYVYEAAESLLALAERALEPQEPVLTAGNFPDSAQGQLAQKAAALPLPNYTASKLALEAQGQALPELPEPVQDVRAMFRGEVDSFVAMDIYITGEQAKKYGQECYEAGRASQLALPAGPSDEQIMRAIEQCRLTVERYNVLTKTDPRSEKIVPMNWVRQFSNTLFAAHPVQASQDGWKLVPPSLTREMRNAWDSAPKNEDDDVEIDNAYRALLAAAPSPAVALPAGPVPEELTDDELNDLVRAACFDKLLLQADGSYIIAPHELRSLLSDFAPSPAVAQPVADERVSRDKDQRREIFVAFRDLASHYTKNRNDIETPQILFAGTKTQAEAHALNAQEAYLDSYPGYREASRKPPCEWKVVAVDSDVSPSSSARQIENDRLIARLFSGAAVPCSTEIDKRGYQWCEAYLDQALNRYRAALRQPAEEGDKA